MVLAGILAISATVGYLLEHRYSGKRLATGEMDRQAIAMMDS
jgi:hypothetical protein